MSSVESFENQSIIESNQTNFQSTNCTENQILPPVRITCCAMLSTLTQYTVDRTGDRVHENNCQNHDCLKLQIVKLFVNHTRSTLGDPISINIVDQKYIEIENNALLKNSQTTLVLALLDRASLPEKLRETHISLEYIEAFHNILCEQEAEFEFPCNLYFEN